MRAFIVMCLVAVACADVSHLTGAGYNYQPVAQHPHTQHETSTSTGVNNQYLAPVETHTSSNTYSHSDTNTNRIQPSNEYSKEFYSFTAPEAEFADDQANQQIADSLKKNLRVVFIKGPENKGLENAALSLARQASEDRTAIYVLNKQADIGDLANKLNALRNNNQQKPEVHFVKYRTAQDAEHAKHAIQSQYDTLQGTSHSHDGGAADVLNFASASVIHKNNPNLPQNQYLPTSVFKFRN